MIHNPNAPEMIHILFEPLELVVGASAANGAMSHAREVVAPLLSSEAILLLSGCLTSRECQFWLSLGDAWTISL